MSQPYSPVRAPRGNTRTAKGWIQEAAKRMLMNNLDPEVAEKPEELIVYGGRGKAARNWECYHTIIETLERLENDQTLLVQSGKAVAVLQTHSLAPRVLLANSNLVPRWANWEEFDKLDAAGLMMYGQMTAGSWIYIGTQGILQGTYETFRGAAKKYFDDSLAGKITVTAGLGGMGGAQPLAIKLAGGVSICVEIDPQRTQRRLQTRYLDTATNSLDEALQLAKSAKMQRKALSIGLTGNAAEVLPKMVDLGFTPDLVTDQTSSHDPMWGYIPISRADEDLNALRSLQPQIYAKRVQESIAQHVQAILEMQRRGAIAFDYGNNLRTQAKLAGVNDAFSYPGFVPAFIRDSFCEGRGPFRWVALSGDPADIAKTDQAMLNLFPEDKRLHEWLTFAGKQIAFQGLPARICWLGYRDRDRAGLLFNQMVRDGQLSAPIVIGRDHLDAGSVASPFRETEGMLDGSDAVSDWALLNFATGIASGAGWMSFHHGGGVGMGYSQHAGLVAVADGSDEAEQRLRMCLTNDPAMGVIRHADAGYELAKTTAAERGIGYAEHPMKETTLITGISQLATPIGIGPKHGRAMRELKIVEQAAMAISDGRIVWTGRESDWTGKASINTDVGGRAVVPGLVDPHTHAIWTGDRLADFEARTSGSTYEEILAADGGIRSTIRATAAASHDNLVALAKPRIDSLIASGATTIEVKSGYGFTPAAELAILEAIQSLSAIVPAQILPTLLIHIPPADAKDRLGYMMQMCEELIPEVAGRKLASAVDIFVEKEAWHLVEAEKLFNCAGHHALPIKLHSDQFHCIGGSELGVRLGALSVDHLEASGPQQIATIAASSTIATILPGVSLHLGIPSAPGRKLIDAGAAVAVGTDLNPGSSPLFSTSQALALSVRLNGITAQEALTAGTVNAACALGFSDRGRLEAGCRADFLVLHGNDWRDLVYTLGAGSIGDVWIGGKRVEA